MQPAINYWNRFVNRAPPNSQGINLGLRVVDGQITKRPYFLPHARRAEHIVIVGKTGTGKTSLIKAMLARDILDGRGFLCIDLHGDLTPFILSRIAEQEHRSSRDLSRRTVILNPADETRSVGINILRTNGPLAPLVSEIVSIFRARWQLDRFGARTEELLRNTLWVLAENGATLTEIAPFLTDLGLRARFVERSQNAEVRSYFRERYEQLSDAMQTIVREAILNKVSAFTTDPAIRHLVGQQDALDLADALDRGLWIVLQLNKASLGDNAETLAALLLARFHNAIYVRRRRELFTLYADEVQNLASSGATLEHLMSEARKFSVSVLTANQHLGQTSTAMRATLLSAGTNIFFRSSPEDAPLVARTLSGGRSTEQLIQELPNRQFLIRSGSDPTLQIAAGGVLRSTTPTADLISRSNACWARSRVEIEAAIAARRGAASGKEVLEEWD